jgi:hypothetical protein
LGGRIPKTNYREENAAHRVKPPPLSAPVIDPLMFAFSLAVEGLSYEPVKRFLTRLGLQAPGKNEFYESQKIVAEAIHRVAAASIAKEKESLQSGDGATLDGAWDHRRNGSLCVVTMMKASTQQIFDYEILERPKQYVGGNTTGPAGNLEMEGMRLIAARWAGDDRLAYYVHDNDGKTRSVIKKSGWVIAETLDTGHSAQAVKRRTKAFAAKHKEIFSGIEKRLTIWLGSVLFRKDKSNTEKVFLWTNSWRHYCGDHSCCLHMPYDPYVVPGRWIWKDDPEKVELFQKFLISTKIFPQLVNARASTQPNESFNRIKAKFLEKSKKYSTSQRMRVEAAICGWNDAGWTEKLLGELHVTAETPGYMQSIIQSKAGQKFKWRCQRVRRSKRAAINQVRRVKRENEALEALRQTGYDMKKTYW